MHILAVHVVAMHLVARTSGRHNKTAHSRVVLAGSFALALGLLIGATNMDARADAANTTVTQDHSNFAPEVVEIAVGDTVTWQWTSGTHTVTATSGNWSIDGDLNSGVQTQQQGFGSSGQYDYECDFHGSSMSGKVYVGISAPTTTTSPPGATTTSTAPSGTTSPTTVPGTPTTNNTTPNNTAPNNTAPNNTTTTAKSGGSSGTSVPGARTTTTAKGTSATSGTGATGPVGASSTGASGAKTSATGATGSAGDANGDDFSGGGSLDRNQGNKDSAQKTDGGGMSGPLIGGLGVLAALGLGAGVGWRFGLTQRLWKSVHSIIGSRD